MNMLKLVVFDCDGVMFSSLETNRLYYNHLLENFQCPQMTQSELEYVHIHNVANSMRHIFRNHVHIDIEKVTSYCQALDYKPFLEHMIMEPDLPDFLRHIKPIYHTAISTNRTNTMDIVLDTFQLRSWFEMVVTASDVDRPKPAPDGLLMILDRFQVQPDEVIYIGDSTVDRDHCASVGIDLIAFKNDNLEAKYHVDSFTAIASLPPFHAAANKKHD